jgi:membrane dipeptidase
MSDEHLRTVAEAGGILGVIAIPHVIHHQDWSIDRVVDHLEHAVDVMGEGAVALGADFVYQLFRAGALPRLLKDTGMPEGITLESAIVGLRGPEDFPNLVEAMARRGWSDELRRAVLHGNALRYLASALPPR